MSLIVSLTAGLQKTFSQTTNIKDLNNDANTTAKRKIIKAAQDSTKSSKGSFVPVPFIITDQNLGYGAIIAVGYIHDNRESARDNTPPSISGIAGGYTTTQTWMIGIGQTHSFKNDKIRYTGAVAYGSANLDFYQLGNIDLSTSPIDINIKAWGTFQRLLFRIGNSDFYIGPQYNLVNATSGLNLKKNGDHPLIDTVKDYLNSVAYQTWLSEIGLYFAFDSRDNTMSPNKGFYTGIELQYNSTWLGASQDYNNENFYFYSYAPLTKWLYSIYHFDAQFTGGDVPFYMKPYVELRGAPILRYQGSNAMLAEMQFRANIYKSISILGFSGAGTAFDSFNELFKSQLIVNYGAGFRYELKKAFGLRIGLDFAWTNTNDFGWYVSIGTGL